MVKDVTSAVVIQFLDEIFYIEGIPQALVTDNGPQFVSKQMENYLEKCGVVHKRIAAFHPEANGQTERCNHGVKEAIQLSVKGGLS